MASQTTGTNFRSFPDDVCVPSFLGEVILPEFYLLIVVTFSNSLHVFPDPDTAHFSLIWDQLKYMELSVQLPFSFSLFESQIYGNTVQNL